MVTACIFNYMHIYSLVPIGITNWYPNSITQILMLNVSSTSPLLTPAITKALQSWSEKSNLVEKGCNCKCTFWMAAQIFYVQKVCTSFCEDIMHSQPAILPLSCAYPEIYYLYHTLLPLRDHFPPIISNLKIYFSGLV